MALKGLDPANLNSGSISGPELMARFGFPALSQRKLNALAVPLAYVDRHQRYRAGSGQGNGMVWCGDRARRRGGDEPSRQAARRLQAMT